MRGNPYATNDQYLAEVLQLVEGYLRLAEGQESETVDDLWRQEQCIRTRCEATVDAGGAVGLEYLFRIFGLTDFERHCVYFSLAPELDSSFESRMADLQKDRCRMPSLGLCLQTYTPDLLQRSALLAQWRGREELLSCFFREGHRGIRNQSDLTPGLKLDRRILHFMQDFMSLDWELREMITIHWPEDELPELIIRGELLERMARVAEGQRNLAFGLWGEAGSGRRILTKHLCSREGRLLLVVDGQELLRQPERWEENLTSVYRETVIFQAALAVVGFEALTEHTENVPEDPSWARLRRSRSRQLLERAGKATDRLFLLSTSALRADMELGPWQVLQMELPMPDTALRCRLWQHELKGCSLGNVELEPLAVKFALQPGQIHTAAQQARREMVWEGKECLDTELLHRACRSQLSHRLGSMASKVNAQYTWEDLILPKDQKRRLQNACAQVEHRHRVYDKWGFGKKMAYGRGISMLFTGPPGTGKTMAAQVIANRLGLELYKVELSSVMSKYIGETEKQLGAVFDEVKKSQSILFFDEADALFGKRSETKDAHDRYANIQTSFLLQKMEEYEGIVILTSNFRQNFDEAFTRRLKFIIEFSLPEREQREEIWRSVIPKELPLAEELDFDFLARSFQLSGSSIKNIATAGAFMAASEDEPMGMVQLLLAIQEEQHKAGKSMSREEFGEYYHQVQQYLIAKEGA